MEISIAIITVSIGLVAICITSIIYQNTEIAVGSLAALAGWLGGNTNGQRNQATQA